MAEQQTASFDSPATESTEPMSQEESAPLDASAILPPTTTAETTPNLTIEDPLNMAVNESAISTNELSVLEPENATEDAAGFETAPEMAEESVESVVDMLQPKVEEDEKSETISKDVGEQRIRFLEARIAAAETERHNANIEMANTANRNAAYKRELEKYKLEANESVAYTRNLKAENVRLDKEYQFLKQSKKLVDAESAKYKEDNERLTTKVQEISDQLLKAKAVASEFMDKNLTLQAELNTLKDNFQAVQFECDKYQTEARLFKSSKEFYSQIESQTEAEKDDLRLKVFQLESEISVALGSLELGRQQMAIEKRTCEQAIVEKDAELNSLREQLQSIQHQYDTLVDNQAQTEAARSQLETQLTEANAKIAHEQKQVQLIRQQYKQKVTEFENQMATARTNLETAQSEAEKVVEAKDSEVLLLRGEIDKMNEKLQMYAKMSNAGDPELMASAAARTAKMMNNASSLTEIYAEHFSLIAELESKKADLREAERTIVQLRDILIEHTPQIQQRQEHFDQAVRDVEILREKLGRYERDREQLLTSRDSCLSELQFTKNSLEEKQRECQTLSKQVQNLVACVQSSGNSESVEEGSELFSSIQELQQRNLELISRIKTMEVEKDEAIRNAQDAQFNELKHKMEVATQNLETSELRSKNLATCKNEAEKQRDYYKKAFDDLQKRAEDALDSPKVNQIRRDKEAAESRAQLAEQQVTDLKQELERNEQQAAAKNELWKNANDEAKAMIATLNNNVETKQAQINNLLDEKRSVTQSLRELEVRHRTQANHTNFLEKGNHKLLEKQTTMNDELQKLHTAKLELDKELQQWKQTAQMTQLELDIIRQRSNADFNLNSTLTELSTILDRKKLLMETMQSSVATKLTAERDEWRQKYESINSEKLQTEGDLKAELFRYQNECTRLEVEWNSARDLVKPLEDENNELRVQCRELTDDLIAGQKQFNENQLSYLNAKIAFNDANLLRKQLDEVLDTAAYWQKRCEQTVLERANEAMQVGEEQEQCTNPNHTILASYIKECKERMEEGCERVKELHAQISTLEIKNHQLNDDMQYADSLITSQTERIAQMEAEYKQYADKLIEIDRDLKLTKAENEKLSKSLADVTSKHDILVVEAQNLKDALQAEELNKSKLHKLLEEKENALSAQMNEFRQYRANFEADHHRISLELSATQQREQELSTRLAETQQEFNQLVAVNNGDNAFEALKRVFEQMREERNSETSHRFQLVTELNELRKQSQEEKQRVVSLLSELETANQTIKAKNEQLEDQQEKMGSYYTLQGKIDALVAERAELQKRIGDLETERNNLFEQLKTDSSQRGTEAEALNTQIDSLETNLRESIERENDLKNAVKAKDEIIGKLRALATKFKNQNDSLSAYQKPQEDKLAELAKQHEQQSAESKQQIEKLTNELKNKQNELKDVQIKLSSTQEALSRAAAQTASSTGPTVSLRPPRNPIRAALGSSINAPINRGALVKDLQNKNQELEIKFADAEQRLKKREAELQVEINRLNEKIIEIEQESGMNQLKVIESEKQLKDKEDEIKQLTMRNQMIGSTLENTRKKFAEFKDLHAQCNVTQQTVPV